MSTWTNKITELIKQDREYRQKNEWPLHPLDLAISYVDPHSSSYLEEISDNKSFTNVNKIHNDDAKQLYTVEGKEPVQLRVKDFVNEPRKMDKIIEKVFKIPGVKECMVIAGGYVCNHILGNNRYRDSTDIDCFFYGDKKTVEDTFLKIKAFFSTIVKQWEIVESRNQYVYNFELSKPHEKTMIFQFITMVFPNKSSIIGQFDISASSVLYDGTDFLTTPIAAFTYGTGYIYIDTTRASPTFEYRLFKYHTKGFGLAFPELDVTKIKELESSENGSSLTYEVVDDKLTLLPRKDITKFQYLYRYLEKYRREEPLTDEFPSIYGEFVNVSKMVDLYYKNKLNKVYFIVKGGVCIVNTQGIRKFYENRTLVNYNNNIYNLRKYYDDKTFKKMINSLFDTAEQNRIRDEFVDKLISSILMYVDKNYNSVDNKINWYTWAVDSTNPLNPSPISPELWYGKYCKENVI